MTRFEVKSKHTHTLKWSKAFNLIIFAFAGCEQLSHSFALTKS